MLFHLVRDYIKRNKKRETIVYKLQYRLRVEQLSWVSFFPEYCWMKNWSKWCKQRFWKQTPIYQQGRFLFKQLEIILVMLNSSDVQKSASKNSRCNITGEICSLVVIDQKQESPFNSVFVYCSPVRRKLQVSCLNYQYIFPNLTHSLCKAVTRFRGQAQFMLNCFSSSTTPMSCFEWSKFSIIECFRQKCK